MYLASEIRYVSMVTMSTIIDNTMTMMTIIVKHESDELDRQHNELDLFYS